MVAFFLLSAFRFSFAANTFSYPWSNPQNGIPGLVSSIYIWALGLAGGAAFVVLIWGAILYTVSGAVDKKSEAKEWIKGAIYGLILLLGAYLILYTINPNLVNLKFDMPVLNISQDTSGTTNPNVIGTIGPGYIAAQSTYQTQSAADQVNASEGRLILQGSSNSGWQTCGGSIQTGCIKPECVGDNTTGCVDVNNMRKATIDEITSFPSTAQACSRISGGTEGGHTDSSGMSHGNGYKFDVSSSCSSGYLDNYISSFASGKDPNGRDAYVHTDSSTGRTAYYVKENNVGSSGQHWDVLVVPGKAS